MSEIPVHPRPRRLSDWINPMEARKVHSLIDKVYQRKNLEVAWERVRANRGSGGVDGISVADFAEEADQHLDRLQAELRAQTYQPQPVRQVSIPKVGKPGEFRNLGIPSIYDRVCQQALLNRLEPIFEPVFDEANFGYRRGRSTHDALRKIWKEIEGGREWIVDADLKDFFGSVDHDKLLTLVAQRIADGRVLGLIKAMLKAGSFGKGRLFPSERGTPQGGVISPLLANIYMHRYIRAFRKYGLDEKCGAVLINYADDFVVLCRRNARQVLDVTRRWMERIGLSLNEDKTCLRNARCESFDFLGYTFGPMYSPRTGGRYNGASPSKKAIKRIKESIRARLRPGNQAPWTEVAAALNRTLRGWANYFCYGSLAKVRSHVDQHVYDRVRHFLRRRHKVAGRGYRQFPEQLVFGELGVVSTQRLSRLPLAHASV